MTNRVFSITDFQSVNGWNFFNLVFFGKEESINFELTNDEGGVLLTDEGDKLIA